MGLRPYLSFGYQLNLALQSESFNGQTVKSQANFNRKFFTTGIDQFFVLSNKNDRKLELGFGAGLNYSIPGKLRLESNNFKADPLEYESTFGFHVDLKMRIQLKDELRLEPGLRFRNLELDTKESLTFSSNYDKFNASGIELGIALVKRIGG